MHTYCSLCIIIIFLYYVVYYYHCIASRVLMAEVSLMRVLGRPRLGWMDGVKVALGNRGMTVEAARQCAKDQKEWRALIQM